MKEEDLNIWFLGLNILELEKITGYESSNFGDLDDFLFNCDEYWDNLTYDDKIKIFNNRDL